MAKDYPKRLMQLVEIQPSGCWRWQGNINADGYGRFGYQGKVIKAHRAAWLILKGPIGDKFVLHKCDVKCCVNPEHLYLGTLKNNVQDRYDPQRPL